MTPVLVTTRGHSSYEQQGHETVSMALEELSTEQWQQLLQDHHFGRFAFLDQVGVMPMIIPVNYSFHAGAW